MIVKLDHFAYNIKPNSLELALEIFEKLGCELNYREEKARWCLIKQAKTPTRIQLIETENQTIDIGKKINVHIGFLSDNPGNDLVIIEKWAKDKGILFKQGGWSDKELWFDLPSVFNNFVVEIMHSSIVE